MQRVYELKEECKKLLKLSKDRSSKYKQLK